MGMRRAQQPARLEFGHEAVGDLRDVAPIEFLKVRPAECSGASQG
ncbi:MAG: hypothetical protein JWN47_548 [Frankiales bacterium]|nr:hypothetical protein [Frankiales bacterium]